MTPYREYQEMSGLKCKFHQKFEDGWFSVVTTEPRTMPVKGCIIKRQIVRLPDSSYLHLSLKSLNDIHSLCFSLLFILTEKGEVSSGLNNFHPRLLIYYFEIINRLPRFLFLREMLTFSFYLRRTNR